MNGTALRYEYKYLISGYGAAQIGYRLRALMETDPHADGNGSYFVRSVYFDDRALSAYYEKLAGVAARVKFRLRFYNMDPERMVFEAKRKYASLTQKDAVPVSRADAERLLAGKPPEDRGRESPLLAEFEARRKAADWKPNVIVDYTRMAFVYPVGDVRVTLDENVCAETYRPENVYRRRGGVPVMENGEAVLEVKFSGQMPPFLAETLADVPKIHCANSKYCSCLSAYL